MNKTGDQYTGIDFQVKILVSAGSDLATRKSILPVKNVES